MKTGRVLILLSTVIWRCCLSQDCPAYYRRSSTDHTYCRSANNSCDVLRSGISDADRNVIVNTHNALRNTVATGNENRNNLPSSTNQVQMVWDNELASIAQRHAQQCVFEHDCNACRAVDNFSVGQNLYQSMTSATNMPTADWRRAVESWNNEVVDFDPDWISPFRSNSAVGHFTQIQWATTWRIGCGYAVFRSSDPRYRFTSLYTCNYGPAGNIQGGEMYNVGNTCSRCPRNTCCGDQCMQFDVTPDYEGLCKSIDNRGPQPPPPPTPNLLYCNFSSDTGECEGTVTGTNRWEFRSLLSGDYISTVIRNGESTELQFPVSRAATNQDSICISFSYRKGPSIAGQTSNNNFQLNLFIPDLSWTSTSGISGNANDWMAYRMSAGWNHATQVSFRFAAGSGAPDQYLDIRNLLIVEGSC